MKDFTELREQCICEVAGLGIALGRIASWSVNKRAKTRWGLCRLKRDGSYEIEIAERLLVDDRISEKACKETIIHELLHTCKGCMRHTGKWKQYAELMNRTYGYNIKRVTEGCEKGVENHKVSEISVIYDKCEKEMRYPMSGGRAFVPLYGSDYTVLLVDHDENRYAVSVPYSNIKMMIPGKLSGYAIPYIQKGRENLDLFLCDLGKNAYTIDMENVGRYKDLAESEFVKKEYRNEIQSSLVRFYYDNDFTRQLTEYLININPIDMTGHERNEIIELMVLGGLCNNALEWMGTYGTYGIDAKIVLRMCDRLLDKDDLGVSAKEMT